MKLQRFLYLYFALWLSFPCIVVLIWMMDCHLLIGTTGTVFSIQCGLNCIAGICGVILAFLKYRETEKAPKNKVVFVATAIGMVFLLSCWNILCIFLNGTEEYHSFTSPDGAHTLIIAERISLISGQVTLYERINPFLIYPRDRIITDDGYRPICAGQYSLIWQGDTVILSFTNGAGSKETISITLDKR